jgi:hypothetical protein
MRIAAPSGPLSLPTVGVECTVRAESASLNPRSCPPSEPRAKRAAGPRERAVTPLTPDGEAPELASAFGRRAGRAGQQNSFGSECVSQALAPHSELNPHRGFQSRERSGPQARGSERSRRSRRAANRSLWTVVLTNAGAPFAALNAYRSALGHAFGAASEAGRRPAGASGHAAHAARRSPGAGQQFRSACRPRRHLRLTAHSGRNSGEFRRPVRGSEAVCFRRPVCDAEPSSARHG